MSHLIGAEKISLEFPTKQIFDEITVGINNGDRIGIVGRNGDGKSTLMKVLAKQQSVDDGRVTYRGGTSVGFMNQQDELPGEQTIRDAVVGDVDEHIWASDSKIRDVINGLLADLDFDKRLDQLSGGQRRRVTLAKLLVGDWDIVMLDEPTNHLDVEGVSWLARHLNNRWPKGSGGLVVVTHDRWFLDEVCNLTWEVFGAKIEQFEGGYAAYILQRNERMRSASASEARRQNLLRKELAWLGRGAPARTTKPKFRIDAAIELIENEPPARDSVELAKMAMTRLGKDVVDVEHLSFRDLFADLTWRLGPGDRVGLVGVNGAGKTTLLNLIAGSLQPEAGRVKRGKTVKLAMLSQNVHELDEFAEERIYNIVKREKSTFQVGKKELTPGQMLEQLGFTQAQLQAPVKDLSGGQRRRFQLMRLMFTEPNVLILDEPTNDFDTDMLTALEDLLDSWPGTLIVVSHDRYLLERVTDNQYALLGDGSISHMPRGIDQYLEIRSGIASTTSEVFESKVESKPQVSGADKRNAEKELSKTERAIEKNKAATAQLQQQLMDTDPSDFDALTSLAQQQKQLAEKQDQLELSWLEISEKLQAWG